MKKKPIQRALIVGATSGIGKETSLQLLQKGWILGLAGRREEKLKELQQLAPDRIYIRAIDICQAKAPDRLQELIDEMGGMDLYLHCSGIGHQNYALSPDIELQTLETNGTGFVRMVTAAFRYFARQQVGHLAVISSIAGTKGLGAAPAYSATKRFQNIYIDSLEQLAYRHPARIRGHRLAERRQALSHADVHGESSPSHRASPGKKETHRPHRLALPHHGSPLAPDTACRLETTAHQELTGTRLSFATISFKRRYT